MGILSDSCARVFFAFPVQTASLAAILLGFLSARRHGWLIAAAIALIWTGISLLPQSHELRYYLFIPLSIATMVGMMFPRVQARYPAVALVALLVVLGEFVWVSNINRHYYRIERVGYKEAADEYNIRLVWYSLVRGKSYCAVGFDPGAFLLTGPTMKEFQVTDSSDVRLCPAGTEVIQKSSYP